MSVEEQVAVVRLFGSFLIQDAETLSSLLMADRSLQLDASECASCHSAVLQVLLAFKPKLKALPPEADMRTLMMQLTC